MELTKEEGYFIIKKKGVKIQLSMSELDRLWKRINLITKGRQYLSKNKGRYIM